MSSVGKIKTLFSDKENTEALFPRTKVKAVSDDDGVGLNVILDDIISKLQNEPDGGSGASVQDVLAALSEQDEVRIKALGVTGDANIECALTVGEQGQTARNLLTWGNPNGDFNDCKQPGFYWMQIPYCTNAPMSGEAYGFLEVIQTHKEYDSGIMQRFTEYYSHQVFVRSYINGGWNSWTNPAYPVGAVYISTDSTSPAQLFGGTWTQIAADRVLMGTTSSSKINTTVEAGLPNITGWFTTRWTDASGGGIIFPAENCQGAFYAGWNGNNYFTGNNNTSGSGGNHYNTANFNAGFSNAIYGRSSTVQPPALYVYMWKRTA